MAGFQGEGAGAIDPETQRFLEVESQKARYHANVHMFTGELRKTMSGIYLLLLGMVLKYGTDPQLPSVFTFIFIVVVEF